MTEQEWLICTDPQRMMLHMVDRPYDDTIRGGVAGPPLISDRKLRLFACACRDYSIYAPFPKSDYKNDGAGIRNPVFTASVWCQGNEWIRPEVVIGFIRDIAGNPFRPVFRDRLHQCGRCWGNAPMGIPCEHTSFRFNETIMSIAQAICDDHRFDDMPILGDALEDAGCDTQDVLRHCRQDERCHGCLGHGYLPTVHPCNVCDGDGWIRRVVIHVHGCWVIDLILGKE